MLEAVRELVNQRALMVAEEETAASQARAKPLALRLAQEIFLLVWFQRSLGFSLVFGVGSPIRCCFNVFSGK